MSRTLLGLMVALPMVVPTASYAGSAYDVLTDKQKRKLKKDGTVVWYVAVADKPWPKSYVYSTIDGVSAEEAMAVFMDFNRHQEFMPDVNDSKVSNHDSARTWEVEYELHVPILRDERYTVRNRLSTYDNGAAYKMSWTKIKAYSTKDIVGNIRFESHGSGTLLAYYNYVVPGRAFSGWVEGRAKKGAVTVVKALGKEARRIKTKDPQRMQQLVDQLRRSLARTPESTVQVHTHAR
ncbi:MAG: SRPBCC family protein [Proteobacteria bacterium]|nr:SRPBCC family protein [Pseudomonadota bacterium]